MDSRALAALLSTLTSTIISLIILFISKPKQNPNPNTLLLSLHLSSSTAAVASLSRKRKSTYQIFSHKVPKLCHNSFKFGQLDSFKLCFKMSASSFEWLSGLLEPLLDIGLIGKISNETRLGIGLFHLSSGASFEDLSKRFNVSEEDARFCVKRLCRVLCTNFRFWVSFPNVDQIQNIQNFPNCCGFISTIHFESSKTDKSVGNVIKVQMVVDSSCRILNIFAGFRGDKSDFTILKHSSLYKDVKEGRVLNEPSVLIDNVEVPRYFIGDGDYPLLPWLITPFIDPLKGSLEDEFNLGVMSSIKRSFIRVVDSLKSWGVLNEPIEGGIKDLVAYIGACSILHNGLLMREDYSALSDEPESSEGFKGRNFEKNSDGNEGSVIRRVLAARAKVDS